MLVDPVGTLPTAECEIFIGQLGGASSRIAPEATAYPHRDANYVMNVHTRWRERKTSSLHRMGSWALSATAPHATGGVYVNFMPEDETGPGQGAYGGNYARLTALKAKYDPDNLFRMNQNVQPKRSAPRQRNASE